MASLACIPADIFREIVKYISAEEGIHKIKRGELATICKRVAKLYYQTATHVRFYRARPFFSFSSANNFLYDFKASGHRDYDGYMELVQHYEKNRDKLAKAKSLTCTIVLTMPEDFKPDLSALLELFPSTLECLRLKLHRDENCYAWYKIKSLRVIRRFRSLKILEIQMTGNSFLNVHNLLEEAGPSLVKLKKLTLPLTTDLSPHNGDSFPNLSCLVSLQEVVFQGDSAKLDNTYARFSKQWDEDIKIWTAATKTAGYLPRCARFIFDHFPRSLSLNVTVLAPPSDTTRRRRYGEPAKKHYSLLEIVHAPFRSGNTAQIQELLAYGVNPILALKWPLGSATSISGILSHCPSTQYHQSILNLAFNREVARKFYADKGVMQLLLNKGANPVTVLAKTPKPAIFVAHEVGNGQLMRHENVVKFALPRTSCSLAQFAITRGDLVTAKHLLEICSPEQLNRPSWRSCALLEVLKNESLLEFLLDNKCIREKFNPNISLLNGNRVIHHLGACEKTFKRALKLLVDMGVQLLVPCRYETSIVTSEIGPKCHKLFITYLNLNNPQNVDGRVIETLLRGYDFVLQHSLKHHPVVVEGLQRLLRVAPQRVVKLVDGQSLQLLYSHFADVQWDHIIQYADFYRAQSWLYDLTNNCDEVDFNLFSSIVATHPNVFTTDLVQSVLNAVPRLWDLSLAAWLSSHPFVSDSTITLISSVWEKASVVQGLRVLRELYRHNVKVIIVWKSLNSGILASVIALSIEYGLPITDDMLDEIHRCPTACQIILTANPDRLLHYRSFLRNTILHLVCTGSRASSGKKLAVLKLLTEAGVNPRVTNASRELPWQCLSHPIEQDCLEYLKSFEGQPD